MKLLNRSTSKLSSTDERLVDSIQALADPSRFRIFKLLLNQRRELCVSEIANELGVSSSAVSQHFRIFELVNMVSRKRYGQKICYSLNSGDPLVEAVSEIVRNKKIKKIRR